ncbi:PA2778 family cysteine peptidase [Marinobacter sp. 1-3A]|uniref:PA2778 family cysteine peptidase n=1 Tax=Marinobacter sp. 1-3A TaxID=2582920 RepID=UPI001908F71B|nr:PA2778 family cysteine peptidase [Marinobacter sp. 1-3A]MBK1872006.1 PA2778 family cysteine peptidase [Marinobacter sp. 1-3A]
MYTFRPRPAGLLLAALLGVILSGCASQPNWPDTSNTVTLTNVPFHPQELYQCGPASLAMMLNAQGVQATPDELVTKVYLPERKGALQVEMVAAARQYGMLVYPLKPELDVLLKEIEAGNPVLVLQNLRFGWWPQWHFAVVIGYDSKKEVLILHSGTEENYRLPASAFMATWDRSERWARVMLPPNQMPVTAEPLEFLMAAHDLETTRQTNAAKAAYSAAAQTWPDQPAALLGLGNLAYQQGNWSEAENYYRTMTERFPDISAGWNNLAEVLSKQGRDRESSAMQNKAQKTKGVSKTPGAD